MCWHDLVAAGWYIAHLYIMSLAATSKYCVSLSRDSVSLQVSGKVIVVNTKLNIGSKLID